jgi:hypothetical protein
MRIKKSHSAIHNIARTRAYIEDANVRAGKLCDFRAKQGSCINLWNAVKGGAVHV